MENNRKVRIVMYHYTRDLVHSRYPNIKGMDFPLFKEQLEFFKKNYNVISMEELLAAANENLDLPENALALTFDDGYIDNYTFAFPLLQELKLTASFYITGKTFAKHELLDVNKIHYILASTDIKRIVPDLKKKLDFYRGREYDYPTNEELWQTYAVDGKYDKKDVVFVKKLLQTVLPEDLRNIISSELFSDYLGVTEEQLAYELYMTENQVRVLKNNGMFIGLHGYDHYWLGNLEKEHMEKDLEAALEIMDEFIDRDNWVMNYPYGSYNQDVLDFVVKKGAKLGLTTEVRVADLNKDNKLLLPRFDCNDFPPKSENYKNF
ncbi:polysaccharide deacetylase family protein [Lachnospira pectinoschiza]|uniref:Polysaccharide deacetylase n=1 Tax=Lachnospira pectinoschiza TaxID=28052 RepID=A0A1G9TF79_9FIRM|nr:polysaccharide deacetylase family protein [Lachnospira pectinoschiza]SDM46248.1 Polysaccharide deacetylase [Lachnospira pectinoschiza]